MPSCPPALAPFEATVAGNQLRFLPSGPDRLAALLAMIDGAATSLRILFYIFAADRAATRVRDAIVAAAARGIKVDMLIDGFGSSQTPDAFFAPIRAAGGRVQIFGTRLTPQYLIRNHQKLVIADGRCVLFGGFNVADGYFAPADDPRGWRDLGVQLSGPMVAPAIDWFDGLMRWMDRPRPRFRDLRALVRRGETALGPLQWVVGGPTAQLSPWARCLRRDLSGARRLWGSVAYFAPNAAMLRRIGRIARRGGEVRLVLPARSDNGATVGAARLLYGFLLKRGAMVSEFAPAMLHCKLLVIDDAVLVGSANLDMRSLYINMELMLRVEDRALADHCRTLIAAQEGESTRITPALHAARATPFSRLRWALSWLLVSVIDYSITRRFNAWLPTGR